MCNIVKRYDLVKDVNAEVHMKVPQTQKAANTAIRCQIKSGTTFADQTASSTALSLIHCGDSIKNLQHC